MSSQLLSFLSTLVGAIVGGGLAVWGSIKAIRETAQNLEVDEIRRQKVECLANLCGLRFVLTDGEGGIDEYKSRLMYEMNKVAMLWSDDPTALKDMRDFYAERTNERFITLIRRLGTTTKFPLENLSDADLRNIFQLALSGR